MRKHYLFISDFDQTLSFNDSGMLLSEILGVPNFEEKVAGLSRLNLVQSGAELTYLLRHDPEYRRVRRDHLVEVGRRVRLKRNIPLLASFLANGIDDYCFDFYVVSAAPEEVVNAALEGILPPDHVIGTRFEYEHHSGEIESVTRVPAGYGKVAAVDAVRLKLGVPRERIIYVGDGSSDIHVMLHVNQGDGFTIAVSEARQITRIAKRTVISEDASSVMVPILEDVVGYSSSEIRALFEQRGVMIQDWDRVRTDWLTIRDSVAAPERVTELALVDHPRLAIGGR